MIDEGVIKFDLSGFTVICPLPYTEYFLIERYRKILNHIQLIGSLDNGLGFGNISIKKNYLNFYKTDQPQFLISGTQTGKLSNLNGEHYTRITEFNIEKFSVRMQGAIPASSETITHASIYQVNPKINTVIHIHNSKIWKNMHQGGFPATSKWIRYGTYEMAIAVKECVGDSTQGIFVMKGHKNGVMAYGPNPLTALNIIARVYNRFVDKNFRFDPLLHSIHNLKDK